MVFGAAGMLGHRLVERPERDGAAELDGRFHRLDAQVLWLTASAKKQPPPTRLTTNGWWRSETASRTVAGRSPNGIASAVDTATFCSVNAPIGTVGTPFE